jgi:hypothetical protein
VCWWFVGTLLGPERTGRFRRGMRVLRVLLGVVVGCLCGADLVLYGRLVLVRGTCRVGFRLLFENCTVDASIFVAKFLRAHGGCLGTRSR